MTTKDTFAPVLEFLSTSQRTLALNAYDLVSTALDAPAMGTLKAWMESHDGQHVTTIQIKPNGDVWSPSYRIVKPHSTFVRLDMSRRDYKGIRVLHTTEHAIIVSDDNGTTISYNVAD